MKEFLITIIKELTSLLFSNTLQMCQKEDAKPKQYTKFYFLLIELSLNE